MRPGSLLDRVPLASFSVFGGLNCSVSRGPKTYWAAASVRQPRSPHPCPLPKERVLCRSSREMSEMPRFVTTRPIVLPLLWGGRGEGERGLRRFHSAGVLSLIPSRPGSNSTLSQIRRPKPESPSASGFGLRISELGLLSALGLRPSDFKCSLPFQTRFQFLECSRSNYPGWWFWENLRCARFQPHTFHQPLHVVAVDLAGHHR